MSKKLGWLNPKSDGNTAKDKAAVPDRSQVGDLGPSHEVQEPRYACGLTGGDCPATGTENCPRC